MGWYEFQSWVEQMNRQRRGPESDPGRLSDPVSRRHWDDAAAKVRRMQAR